MREEIVSWMKRTKDHNVYKEGDTFKSLTDILKGDKGSKENKPTEVCNIFPLVQVLNQSLIFMFRKQPFILPLSMCTCGIVSGAY